MPKKTNQKPKPKVWIYHTEKTPLTQVNGQGRLFLHVSPEQAFIRTGIKTEGLDQQRVQRLGRRFLSRKLYDAAKEKKHTLPLPTFRQRNYGGKLPKRDLIEIETQMNKAIEFFGKHLSPAKRAEIRRAVSEKITGRILSINTLLREKTPTDIVQMRKQGKELLTYIKEEGELYSALMQEHNGKVYFAKGWTSDKIARVAPIHETIHALQRMGVIRTDVPFAQAADRLYGLEQGILKIEQKMRAPTEEEFDKKARPDKAIGGTALYEANWSYAIGDRIGQWLFTNIREPEKRWEYLYHRTMGESHQSTLAKIQ